MCGGRFFYEGPEVSFDKGMTGKTQRVDDVVQCPDCGMFSFYGLILNSYVNSKNNWGIIIEDEY